MCVSEEDNRSIVVVKNGKDSLDMCRVVNGMWQTSGGWGKIDRDNAVDAMLKYADAGLTTFDMADIYGPAEDLYGIFINRIRRERPPEVLDRVRGWDYSNRGYLDALKHLNDLKEEG
ncbi:oxidoreductase [Populus alba x Populus x berolinensis]|uniref:Oxidoreductase n=1 Tax=Populus alba x Populus x berolinensis TaxID=444605 RepID=A0AAD6QBG0_9ROSI|nr:oxidoreductase [Populus alba x Populus x berolinensis]